MRALYLSRADQFDDRSSLVIIAKSLIRHMLAADPEMYVSWVVPRGVKDELLQEFILMPMGELGHRLRFVKCMAGLSGRTLGYLMTEDVWYQLTQTKVDVPYDVVLSNQMALTPIWSTVLANRYMNSRYQVAVPIVNWQMWTATTQQLREVPEYYAGEADVVAESVASMFATNVWESEVLRKAHLDTIREYVQPSVVRKVTGQSVTIANGVDWPALEKVFKKRQIRAELGDVPVLFWGGRLSNQKKPRVTFPLMAKVAATAGCGVVVSTNRPESDDDVAWARAAYPDWTIYTKVDRAGFHWVMADGDVFMCDSPSESYGVAWLEMLAAGLLGVFAPAWWNETLLPEWYPFRSADAGERVEMAVALVKSWPDGPLWRRYVPMVRSWIESEHNEQTSGAKLATLLNAEKARAMSRDAGKARGTIAQLADRACAELAMESAAPGDPVGVTEDDVYGRMKALSDSSREFGKPGDVMSRMYLRRCLEGRGWRDTCQSPVVRFVR
jgi:hypothetical protein